MHYRINSRLKVLGKNTDDLIPIIRSDGRKDTKLNTQWTQKGRLMIHHILEDMGIYANIDKN